MLDLHRHTGQRLSRCTCPNTRIPEDHPGPLLTDGTLRGRAAPELDIFEIGAMNSASLQAAPFDLNWEHDTDGVTVRLARLRVLVRSPERACRFIATAIKRR